MPRQYSSSVRRQIVSRLRSGEPVAAVAAETGVCKATLFRWKRQALIEMPTDQRRHQPHHVDRDPMPLAHRFAPSRCRTAPHRDSSEKCFCASGQEFAAVSAADDPGQTVGLVPAAADSLALPR